MYLHFRGDCINVYKQGDGKPNADRPGGEKVWMKHDGFPKNSYDSRHVRCPHNFPQAAWKVNLKGTPSFSDFVPDRQLKIKCGTKSI